MLPTCEEHLVKCSATVRVFPGNCSVLNEAAVVSEGSAVCISEYGNRSWFITAAHVVRHAAYKFHFEDENKREIRFKDVIVYIPEVENGEFVGWHQYLAKVVKFSCDILGYDIAVLMAKPSRKVVDYHVDISEKTDIKIGMPITHVGSLLGIYGSNSLTKGYVSAVGRIFSEKVFDQVTCDTLPGSSGGGVFDSDFKLLGIISRTAGSGFRLMVPARIIRKFLKQSKIEFLIDDKADKVSIEELLEQSPIVGPCSFPELKKKRKDNA
jgi:S1-C subfamily serine protease